MQPFTVGLSYVGGEDPLMLSIGNATSTPAVTAGVSSTATVTAAATSAATVSDG